MISTACNETIYAVASGAGLAGVAVVRISGGAAADALVALSRRETPAPRRAMVRTLVDPGTGDALDQALVLWFPAPKSFTGEDVVELHLHGGRAVIAGVLAALAGIPGLRPAEAGEFTRRAFDHGKLDLTAAEGLADLVAAETAAQRRQALRQMDGALEQVYESWRWRLTETLAYLEASIDFSDQDLPEHLAAVVEPTVRAILDEIDRHLADGRRAQRLRDGISVVIFGAPNVGKSSLLNCLAQREAAIVSTQAGTTRDVIEVRMDLAGFPVIVADTAGLREALDDIERIGVARAHAEIDKADLTLAVIDASAGALAWQSAVTGLVDDRCLIVANKSDLQTETRGEWGGYPVFSVSARTGAGLGRLLESLASRVAQMADTSAAPGMTRERHRHALQQCRDHLMASLTAPLPELTAEDLRLAARHLGRITGRVDVEEVLDVVFREFCIGK